MCGIAGYVGWERGASESAAELAAMCDAIRHRGPDDAGYLVEPGIALGMRRLSIIDLPGGAQPIGNEDATVHVVFNGEIYNYRELRQRLLHKGHHFATRSDTETLVHLYEDHGARLVEHLRGMFAFAVWDAAQRKLVLARDRLGIKPLYYWETEQGLAFASELKSLLALDYAPREIDSAALASYLALGYVPDPQCIFRGVRKLPPGHVLSWSAENGAEITRYWSPVVPEDPTISEQQAAEEIRRLLAEAVRYRLISDVPLGAFLSGGIDSSAVAAEMARQMDQPVKTFSIGFDHADYNEAPHAASVAQQIGADHTELVVRPEVDSLFEQVALAFDEPFADSSAIPTWIVSRLAREQVTVVLSGDGGDELFGGYTRFLDLIRRDAHVPWAARSILGGLARRLPHSAPGRNRLLELSRGSRGRYAGMVASALSPREGGIARPEVAGAAADLDRLLDPWFDQVSDRDFPSQAMFVDLMTYLPGDILTKVDRMSMAVSLEARVPLLDHHMVEFAASLPRRLKIADGEGKSIFRKAIRGLVPDSVLDRPKKGFAVPLDLWFRDELRHRIAGLTEPHPLLYDYLDIAAVRRIVKEHLSRRRDHGLTLWRILVLRIWMDALAEGTAPDRIRHPCAISAPRRI